MNSANRMKYIAEYLSAYEEKIKMCNDNSLFDEAKMFELFAKEACKLYFNQEFFNLNTIKKNYPYVDLVSADKNIYVQVSTEKCVQSKIKETLKKLSNDTREEFESIKEVYFFMLHNDSVRNVKDLTGDNQIGNVPFIKEKNLITTKRLIQKANDDLDFQESFYTMIKKEFDNFNVIIKQFENQLEISKNVGLENISTLINNEYEINRTDMIEQIRNDNFKFISIQGSEGSGKSALCKKLVQNEELVLFSRAERFVEENHIDDIWNININELLDLLSGKKIIFVIDALEFISDSSKTKIDLLESLYSIADKYDNAYIITTCRRSDKNAFLRIESKYPVHTYDVNEISDEELLQIEKKYPIIANLNKKSTYKVLLKSPFYINLIISNNIAFDDLDGINNFRKYIWENIICIKNKSGDYKVSYSDVIKEVEKITFDRAINFLLGIDEVNLDTKIMDALLTEGILSKGNYGIRLKYDIYEDICFEQYFDRVLSSVRGNYNAFFEKIEGLGQSVYRRYQIWISNKLFALRNKDSVIYNFLLSNKIPDNWKTQTVIGIVKSDFCLSFFEDYESELVDNGLIAEYIKIINMYSYDARIDFSNKLFNDVELIPVGLGREGLVKIIYNNELYKKDLLEKRQVVKLCYDFSNQLKNVKEENTINLVCEIVEFYIEQEMLDITISPYNKADRLSLSMSCLFNLAHYSKDWLSELLRKLIEDLSSDDDIKTRISEDMCSWIFKHCNFVLAKELSEDLCEFANGYWFANNKKSEKKELYYGRIDSLNSSYGLSYYAENYDYEYRYSFSNMFLFNIFRSNFKIAFPWAINFINTCVNSFRENNGSHSKVEIRYNNEVKEYIGTSNMWLAGIKEYCVPEIIGDLVYQLKNTICEIVDCHKEDKEFVNNFLKNIKSEIYNKSNNVILLSIIESIGFYYESEIPGYLVEICSSMDIINWDVSRFSTYIKNPVIESLERKIYLSFGLSGGIEKRYPLNQKFNMSLITYMQNLQIYYGKKCRDKAYEIFDYLYGIIPNDKINAMNYLQIQKMDLRGAKQTIINDNVMMLESKITGEAKKIADKSEEKRNIDNALFKEAAEFIAQNKTGSTNVNDLIKIIDSFLLKCSDESNRILFEPYMIILMAIALKSDNLEKKYREIYVNYWINDIEKIFVNENSNSESTTFFVLLEQLKTEIDDKIKNKIKKLVLNIIINDNNNGIISNYLYEVKKYLKNNNDLSLSLFNTIIKLSEDEMNHQRYNADYLITSGKNKESDFIPNMVPKLYGVDRLLQENNETGYISKKDKILNKYLFNGEKLEIDCYNMDHYDINMLANICNCSISIKNICFKELFRNMFKTVINIISRSENRHHFFDTYDESKITGYFSEELVKSNEYNETLMNILFDDIDFSIFTNDTIEFYESIFADFPLLFIDGYSDNGIRRIFKKKMKYIENKINLIEKESIKNRLFKLLTFHIYKYCYHLDISKYKAEYNYRDKMYINSMISKYGKYHINDIFNSIYYLKINELLPEILLSLKDLFTLDYFLNTITDNERKIINIIIVESFIKYCDAIKEEQNLIDAFETILNVMILDGSEKASVLLDEFRIH